MVVAQIYKWVDEKGVTHYGERPAGKNAQPLRDSAGGPPLRDSTAGPPEEEQGEKRGPVKPVKPPRAASETALQRQEREFQQRHESRQREEQRAREAQARSAESASGSDCRRANADLTVIRRNPTNYTYADEARAKDNVARHCR
jgi:hypothetical protein